MSDSAAKKRTKLNDLALLKRFWPFVKPDAVWVALGLLAVPLMTPANRFVFCDPEPSAFPEPVRASGLSKAAFAPVRALTRPPLLVQLLIEMTGKAAAPLPA